MKQDNESTAKDQEESAPYIPCRPGDEPAPASPLPQQPEGGAESATSISLPTDDIVERAQALVGAAAFHKRMLAAGEAEHQRQSLAWLRNVYVRLASAIGARLLAPSLPEGPDPEKGRDLDPLPAVADASRQIRENIGAVDFNMAVWESSEYVICLCGKPIGDTQTEHDANVILAWLRVAWREIAEDLFKVSPETKTADYASPESSILSAAREYVQAYNHWMSVDAEGVDEENRRIRVADEKMDVLCGLIGIPRFTFGDSFPKGGAR